MPVAKLKPVVPARPIKLQERRLSAYSILRKERKNAKTLGIRTKKAKEAAEDAAVTAKK